MERCQREGLRDQAVEAVDLFSQYDNATLEIIALIAERAYSKGSLSYRQNRILRWVVSKCYDLKDNYETGGE
jgi:hypothetical protein